MIGPKLPSHPSSTRGLGTRASLTGSWKSKKMDIIQMCVLGIIFVWWTRPIKILLINFTSEEIQILEESSFGMVKTDLFREWHLKMALILFRFWDVMSDSDQMWNCPNNLIKTKWFNLPIPLKNWTIYSIFQKILSN